jgi:hypothetical protein
MAYAGFYNMLDSKDLFSGNHLAGAGVGLAVLVVLTTGCAAAKRGSVRAQGYAHSGDADFTASAGRNALVGNANPVLAVLPRFDTRAIAQPAAPVSIAAQRALTVGLAAVVLEADLVLVTTVSGAGREVVGTAVIVVDIVV